MPRQSKIKRSWSENGTRIEREYRVTYTDDSEERAEAVRFFGKGLFPATSLPERINRMSEEAGQKFLDDHPMQQRWQMLTLDNQRFSFEDDDLRRLQFIPELEHLHSHATHLTDRGVSHFRQIPDLQHLLLYSPLVTDACLQDIAALRNLRTIDLQGSHLVTRSPFDRLVRGLRKLEDIYPPFDGPLSEILDAAAKPAGNEAGRERN